MPGPVVDYAKLKEILASPAAVQLPPALRQKMAADVAAHDAAGQTGTMVPSGLPAAPAVPAVQPDASAVTSPFQQARDASIGQVNAQNESLADATASLIPRAAMQFAHDMTLGITPDPYAGMDPSMVGRYSGAIEPVVKIASGITSVMLQGAGLLKGLSFVGRVPLVSQALEFLPTRLQEIGVGALINGGIDALRADGIPKNPDGTYAEQPWYDPSAKLAKPLAEAGVPERLALGVGGGVVGGLLGPVVLGITSGFQAARATRLAWNMTPEIESSIRDALGRAGVDAGGSGSKYELAQSFIKNIRKVNIGAGEAGVVADQLSREQYITNELTEGNANSAQPSTPSPVPNSKVQVPLFHGTTRNTAGLPLSEQFSQGGFFGKGIYLNESPDEAVHSFAGMDPTMGQVTPGGSIHKVFADIRKPFILSNPVDKDVGLRMLRQVEKDFPENTDGVRLSQDPSFLSVKKKVVSGQATGHDIWSLDSELEEAGYANEAGQVAESLRQSLENQGYDAINMKGKVDDAFGGHYLVFKGSSLKSAFQVQQEQMQTEMDGRLVAGIFRNNPGGVNVVTSVRGDPEATINVAKQRLGVNISYAVLPKADGSSDVLIARPSYVYPSAGDKQTFGRLTQKVSDRLSQMAKDAATSVTAPKTTEAFILTDGEPIRGGLNTTAMMDKMRIQKPVVDGVERPDLALREAAKYIRMDIGEPGNLTVELPRKISQEQFNALGRSVDAMKFDQVTVVAADGSKKVFDNPIGGTIQDHVASVIKPVSAEPSFTPKLIDQYKRTGVFSGQAVVLPDGTAAQILNKQGPLLRVKESLTGAEFTVHPKNVTVLPTTLSSELQPSNLFTSYMTDPERQALAKLRTSIANGWAEPIAKYRDFESFANSRGYMSNAMKGGKVQLMKVNDGGAEPLLFKNVAAAVEWVRKDSAPMAELADQDVARILGPDRNLGYIGGGGPAPRFNELMPIDWKRQEETIASLATDRGPGLIQTWLKPTIPLLRDLDERFGTQMYKAAYNLQTQQIARQNFEALWLHGKGGALPDGVAPLARIIKMAGPNADRELMFDWREADPAGKVEIEKLMKPNELAAAKALGSWFDAIYPALGIDAPFVENYMPRYREALQSGNAMDLKAFWAQHAPDAMHPPAGIDFISDHVREGLLDVYNKDPFQVANQYLRAGAKNRFMKTAQDEAREMVRTIAAKNENVALPLANMIQAMGGYEFSEQRAMLNETFRSVLDKLPGQGDPQSAAALADKWTNYFTSAVYASTMGFRPSLALRNAKDVMVMAYPLYGGPRFYEALGRAMTSEGYQEARLARAVSSYSTGMLNVEEDMPKWKGALGQIQEASTLLYDSADEFTRASTYYAAKFKAEDALAKFAQKADGVTNANRLAALKDGLLKDSRIYLHGDEVSQEFLRRAASSPEEAARFAGKTASDMTNFLYGRGMQARWMRSTAGRFFGQFGSWSMWYLDYLTRMTRAAVSGPNRADALTVLGRHALVNAAIIAAGKEVLNVDLSRWASYGALFYSGGPGATIATGAMTAMRGLGEVTSLGEDPLSKSRVSSGAQVIWNTLPTFVPFYFAGRDVLTMAKANDQTELLAATLGTKPTRAYLDNRRLSILLGDYTPSFLSTSGALQGQVNNQLEQRGPQPVDIRTIPPGGIQTYGVAPAPTPAPAGAPSTSASVSQTRPAFAPLKVQPPPGINYQSPNEVKKTIETKPPEGF